MQKSTHAWITSAIAAVLLGVTCGPCFAIEKHTASKAAGGGIPWAEDYAEAKKLAAASKLPMDSPTPNRAASITPGISR